MPITVRTISVIRSVRALIARLCLGGRFDRFFEALRVRQRVVFVFLERGARLPDQERGGAGEAVVVRGLLVGRDFRFEPRVVAVGLPRGQVQPGTLLSETLEVALGDVAAVLSALLVVEELDEVP